MTYSIIYKGWSKKVTISIDQDGKKYEREMGLYDFMIHMKDFIPDLPPEKVIEVMGLPCIS